jgi:anti-sigma factor RsiW
MSHLGNLISALVDGELGGVELDRANAHLAGCAACRTEAAQLRELKRELRALGDLDDADAVTSRLLALVVQGAAGGSGVPVTARPLQRQPGRRARRRPGRYAVWGAMSLVVVGVGAAAFGMGGTPAGNEPQITPQLEVFDLQHAMNAGDVPFAGPAAARPKRPAKKTVKAPVNAWLLRAAMEAARR